MSLARSANLQVSVEGIRGEEAIGWKGGMVAEQEFIVTLLYV